MTSQSSSADRTAQFERCNVGDYLTEQAAASPDRRAVIDSRRNDVSLTYAELELRSNRYSGAFAATGISREHRVLVAVRPGADFLAIMFSLFKLGATPVLIDPGLGIRRCLDCLRSVNVTAFVGIPGAHVTRLLCRRALPSLRQVVTVGRRWFWGGHSLHALAERMSDRFESAATTSSDAAAILFTSGSTGAAKGVAYEHGMFDAQIRAIRSHYHIQPGEVDLPCFAPFALFSIAMGMTCVIPDMDPSRPAKVDPAKIVRTLRSHHVTSTFGSPAIWRRVASHCLERGIFLPDLKRVLMAGAPVPWRLVDDVRRVLNPAADVYTPYGATEAMPICSISGCEILNGCGKRHREGGGTCVGESLDGIDVTVLRIRDEPISEWSDDLLVDDGEIGELAVTGPVVTREYVARPDATALAKIHEGDTYWHRMGDVGYRDEDGRVWYCGRKDQRVMTEIGVMYTDPCEAIFKEHHEVHRSALVGVGKPGSATPVMVIEPKPGRFGHGAAADSLRVELLSLARASKLTERITHVLIHPSFPVDVRHNIKINREALAAWAAKRIR